MSAGYVLTVTDSTYRGRVLAVHDGLTRTEARELMVVYVALGYPPICITLMPALAGEQVA